MSHTRVGVAVLALTLLGLPAASAQVPAECPTSECAAPGRSPVSSRLWIEAASVHRLKLEFVDALQVFTRAQAGTFGDEGDALRRAVAEMRESLSRWDGAIQQFLAGARRVRLDADVHVVLATVLLDRHRIDEALRELGSAQRQDADRLDVYTLQALAHGTSGRPLEAARALRKALALDPANPAVAYSLTQYLSQLKQSDDASRTRQLFQRAVPRPVGSASPRKAITPFERVDLLKQGAGVAPVFPQARYASGFAALDSGDYATAVARWSDAVAPDPLVTGDAGARDMVVRAAALLREGKLSEALQQLQAVIGSAPDYAEAHRLLGLAYWIDDQQGRSIESLRAAIRLAPTDERARLVLADVLAQDRRFSEAERELTLAGEAGIQSGQVMYRLAQVYERQSLLPQAAKAFQQSEAFGPMIGRDYFYKAFGSLLVNQADFDGAIAAYTKRIDVNPNHGEAHRQLGEIYFLQGRHEEALAEFAAATWLDPGDARAYAAAGQAYVRLLKYAEAVDAFERALSLDGGLREARYGLGTSLMRLGRADEARKALEVFQQQQTQGEALGQRDFQLDALRRQASRELLSGAQDRALALYQEALNLDPRSARSHRELGLAFLKAGRPGDAVPHLQTAQQLEETSEGFAYLADAYLAAGDPDEAMRQRVLARVSVLQRKLDRIQDLLR